MKQAKILTKAEYRRVMHVIDAHRYAVRNRTMFALSFYAGLRACEIGGWLILNQEISLRTYLKHHGKSIRIKNGSI